MKLKGKSLSHMRQGQHGIADTSQRIIYLSNVKTHPIILITMDAMMIWLKYKGQSACPEMVTFQLLTQPHMQTEETLINLARKKEGINSFVAEQYLLLRGMLTLVAQ